MKKLLGGAGWGARHSTPTSTIEFAKLITDNMTTSTIPKLPKLDSVKLSWQQYQ